MCWISSRGAKSCYKKTALGSFIFLSVRVLLLFQVGEPARCFVGSVMGVEGDGVEEWPLSPKEALPSRSHCPAFAVGTASPATARWGAAHCHLPLHSGQPGNQGKGGETDGAFVGSFSSSLSQEKCAPSSQFSRTFTYVCLKFRYLIRKYGNREGRGNFKGWG